MAAWQVALFSVPFSDQGVNMNVSSFVLSAIKRFRGNVGSEILRCFGQLVAPLSLRKSRCIGYRALAHNKSNQFAPVGAGRSLRPRRCLKRYE